MIKPEHHVSYVDANGRKVTLEWKAGYPEAWWVEVTRWENRVALQANQTFAPYNRHYFLKRFDQMPVLLIGQNVPFEAKDLRAKLVVGIEVWYLFDMGEGTVGCWLAGTHTAP